MKDFFLNIFPKYLKKNVCALFTERNLLTGLELVAKEGFGLVQMIFHTFFTKLKDRSDFLTTNSLKI